MKQSRRKTTLQHNKIGKQNLFTKGEETSPAEPKIEKDSYMTIYRKREV